MILPDRVTKEIYIDVLKRNLLPRFRTDLVKEPPSRQDELKNGVTACPLLSATSSPFPPHRQAPSYNNENNCSTVQRIERVGPNSVVQLQPRRPSLIDGIGGHGGCSHIYIKYQLLRQIFARVAFRYLCMGAPEPDREVAIGTSTPQENDTAVL